MSVIEIGGRDWVLGALIGSGGFGEVYVATSGLDVGAVKLIPKSTVGLRERLLADDLRGVPNVVPILGVGETNSHWALLMPLAEKSLRKYLDELGRVDQNSALSILIDVARALDGLATMVTLYGDKGVCHRDLKPENILSLQGQWCISDFGTGRYVEADTATDTQRYHMTWMYAAPEQWLGETATILADVYALGVVGHELLAGSRPFRGPNHSDYRRQHLHETPPKIIGIAPTLASIVSECLYKVPGSRPEPHRLLDRLKRARTAPQPAGGRAALQEANLAHIRTLGERSERELHRLSRLDRRKYLLEAARSRYEEISSSLRCAVTADAPTVTDVDNKVPGWQFFLGQGSLGCFGPWEVHLTPQLEQLPLDIVACAYVAVGRPTPAGVTGRAHSLWYCNAKNSDLYGWYEIAFDGWPCRECGSDNRRMYLTNPTPPASSLGNYAPFAVHPDSREALHVFGVRVEHGDHYSIAWSFRRVEDNPVEFVDRWVGWFAAASQGNLPYPSTVRTPSVRGSWRGPHPVPTNEHPRAGGLFRHLRRKPAAEPAPTTSEPSWTWPEDVPRDVGIPRLDTYWDAIATGGDALRIWEERQGIRPPEREPSLPVVSPYADAERWAADMARAATPAEPLSAPPAPQPAPLPIPTEIEPDASESPWGSGMLAQLAERVQEIRDLVPSPDGLPQTYQADWFAAAITTEHELKVARRHATRSFDAAIEGARGTGQIDYINDLNERRRAVLQAIGRRSNELREEERALRTVAELAARTRTATGQEDFEVVGDGLPTEAQVQTLATTAQSEDELNVVREFVRRRAAEGHREAIRRTRAGSSDEGARMQQHIIETEPRLMSLLDERAGS